MRGTGRPILKKSLALLLVLTLLPWHQPAIAFANGTQANTDENKVLVASVGVLPANVLLRTDLSRPGFFTRSEEKKTGFSALLSDLVKNHKENDDLSAKARSALPVPTAGQRLIAWVETLAKSLGQEHLTLERLEEIEKQIKILKKLLQARLETLKQPVDGDPSKAIAKREELTRKINAALSSLDGLTPLIVAKRAAAILRKDVEKLVEYINKVDPESISEEDWKKLLSFWQSLLDKHQALLGVMAKELGGAETQGRTWPAPRPSDGFVAAHRKLAQTLKTILEKIKSDHFEAIKNFFVDSPTEKIAGDLVQTIANAVGDKVTGQQRRDLSKDLAGLKAKLTADPSKWGETLVLFFDRQKTRLPEGFNEKRVIGDLKKKIADYQAKKGKEGLKIKDVPWKHPSTDPEKDKASRQTRSPAMEQMKKLVKGFKDKTPLDKLRLMISYTTGFGFAPGDLSKALVTRHKGTGKVLENLLNELVRREIAVEHEPSFNAAFDKFDKEVRKIEANLSQAEGGTLPTSHQLTQLIASFNLLKNHSFLTGRSLPLKMKELKERVESLRSKLAQVIVNRTQEKDKLRAKIGELQTLLERLKKLKTGTVDLSEFPPGAELKYLEDQSGKLTQRDQGKLIGVLAALRVIRKSAVDKVKKDAKNKIDAWRRTSGLPAKIFWLLDNKGPDNKEISDLDTVVALSRLGSQHRAAHLEKIKKFYLELMALSSKYKEAGDQDVLAFIKRLGAIHNFLQAMEFDPKIADYKGQGLLNRVVDLTKVLTQIKMRRTDPLTMSQKQREILLGKGQDKPYMFNFLLKRHDEQEKKAARVAKYISAIDQAFKKSKNQEELSARLAILFDGNKDKNAFFDLSQEGGLKFLYDLWRQQAGKGQREQSLSTLKTLENTVLLLRKGQIAMLAVADRKAAIADNLSIRLFNYSTSLYQYLLTLEKTDLAAYRRLDRKQVGDFKAAYQLARNTDLKRLSNAGGLEGIVSLAGRALKILEGMPEIHKKLKADFMEERYKAVIAGFNAKGVDPNSPLGKSIQEATKFVGGIAYSDKGFLSAGEKVPFEDLLRRQRNAPFLALAVETYSFYATDPEHAADPAKSQAVHKWWGDIQNDVLEAYTGKKRFTPKVIGELNNPPAAITKDWLTGDNGVLKRVADPSILSDWTLANFSQLEETDHKKLTFWQKQQISVWRNHQGLLIRQGVSARVMADFRTSFEFISNPNHDYWKKKRPLHERKPWDSYWDLRPKSYDRKFWDPLTILRHIAYENEVQISEEAFSRLTPLKQAVLLKKRRLYTIAKYKLDFVDSRFPGSIYANGTMNPMAASNKLQKNLEYFKALAAGNPTSEQRTWIEGRKKEAYDDAKKLNANARLFIKAANKDTLKTSEGRKEVLKAFKDIEKRFAKGQAPFVVIDQEWIENADREKVKALGALYAKRFRAHQIVIEQIERQERFDRVMTSLGKIISAAKPQDKPVVSPDAWGMITKLFDGYGTAKKAAEQWALVSAKKRKALAPILVSWQQLRGEIVQAVALRHIPEITASVPPAYYFEVNEKGKTVKVLVRHEGNSQASYVAGAPRLNPNLAAFMGPSNFRVIRRNTVKFKPGADANAKGVLNDDTGKWEEKPGAWIGRVGVDVRTANGNGMFTTEDGRFSIVTTAEESTFTLANGEKRKLKVLARRNIKNSDVAAGNLKTQYYVDPETKDYYYRDSQGKIQRSSHNDKPDTQAFFDRNYTQVFRYRVMEHADNNPNNQKSGVLKRSGAFFSETTSVNHELSASWTSDKKALVLDQFFENTIVSTDFKRHKQTITDKNFRYFDPWGPAFGPAKYKTRQVISLTSNNRFYAGNRMSRRFLQKEGKKDGWELFDTHFIKEETNDKGKGTGRWYGLRELPLGEGVRGAYYSHKGYHNKSFFVGRNRPGGANLRNAYYGKVRKHAYLGIVPEYVYGGMSKEQADKLSRKEYERKLKAWAAIIKKYNPPKGLGQQDIGKVMSSIFIYGTKPSYFSSPGSVSPSRYPKMPKGAINFNFGSTGTANVYWGDKDKKGYTQRLLNWLSDERGKFGMMVFDAATFDPKNSDASLLGMWRSPHKGAAPRFYKKKKRKVAVRTRTNYPFGSEFASYTIFKPAWLAAKLGWHGPERFLYGSTDIHEVGFGGSGGKAGFKLREIEGARRFGVQDWVTMEAEGYYVGEAFYHTAKFFGASDQTADYWRVRQKAS